MDKFLASYIETALWSSTDGTEEGTPLDDSKYSDTELAEETLATMKKDCELFELRSDILFEAYRNTQDGDGTTGNYSERRERVAHDFWLTRNRHGAGFWDGDYPEPLGRQLTDLAQGFSECYLYIGDDGKFYL
jgi:hypothetical protein